MRQRPFCLLGLLALAAGTATAQSAATSFAGYVFEVSGSWRVSPQYAADLTVGQGVRDGDIVKLNVYRSDAHISIGLIDKTIARRDCRGGDNSCRDPLTIQTTATDTSLGERLINVWNRLVKPPAQALVFTESRGAGDSVILEDGVVPLVAGKPDLSGPLEMLSPGMVDLVLNPMAGRAPVHLKADWRKPGLSISGPAVRPGLYVLNVSPEPAEQAAFVLIAPPAEAKSLASDFADAKAVAAAWPSRVKHAYYASVLSTLYRESPRGH